MVPVSQIGSCSVAPGDWPCWELGALSRQGWSYLVLRRPGRQPSQTVRDELIVTNPIQVLPCTVRIPLLLVSFFSFPMSRQAVGELGRTTSSA